MNNILIVDDDEALCRSIQIIMKTKGRNVRYANSAGEGWEEIRTERPDLIFLDLVLPDADGLDILEELAKQNPGLPVVVISGRQDMSATINAMRHGACDYLRKPFDVDDIELTIEKLRREFPTLDAPEPPRNEAAPPAPPHEIVASDPRMLDVLKQIGRFSRSRINVLIQGESGTGKELVARAIHEATSPGKPFVAINCSAIVPTLLESELFGHEKGAFTGADRQKSGKLERAADGTVFFDEIGDMDTDLQAKLLRVLQEHRFERVGGHEELRFRARSVFATHCDLAQMVHEGTFREDLYYRVAVGEIHLPPLRERPADIALLARHFLQTGAGRMNRHMSGFSDEAKELLTTHRWPGNVRELENVVTRAIALSESPQLHPEHIRLPGGDIPSSRVDSTAESPKTLADAERLHINKVLISNAWNITHSAQILAISPTTLRKKIKDYKLKAN